eukprot:403344047
MTLIQISLTLKSLRFFNFFLSRDFWQESAQCAGDYLDVASQKISVSFFTYELFEIQASITTLDFNQPATKAYTFKIFYQAQNGLQVYFYASFFKNLYSSVLAGYVSQSTNPEWGIGSNQAVLIDLPEPYYFSMGDPITKSVNLLNSTQYQFDQNLPWNYTTQEYTFTYEPTTYYDLIPAVTGLIKKQVIDFETNRSLSLPGINSTYNYTIKMQALIIEFGVCVYDQNCTDEVIAYSILFQNGSAIPKQVMTFSSITRRLIVSSTDKTSQGQYDLMFRCSLIDEFYSYKNFTVNILYDSTVQTYFPNYAPEFLEQLQKRWTIRAGSEATFTLPKYFDPNPEDQVSVKLETVEKYKSFFQIQDQKFILFNAGFPELGDIEMIITLSDNHKPQPKSTKYRMTITFMQSPFGQMKNDYVNQVNVSTPLIYSFDSNKVRPLQHYKYYAGIKESSANKI